MGRWNNVKIWLSLHPENIFANRIAIMSLLINTFNRSNKLTMQISVFEILRSPNAMFHQDGLKLHSVMTEAMAHHRKVTIDFAQLNILTTQFLNASFGKMMMEKGLPYFYKHIQVINTDHLTTYATKMEWVIDNIKNTDEYRSVLDAVLA